MSGAPDLTRLVPGFDFLQGLMKNAGAGLPGMGQWIAPTLNPEELDKRIQELKTVQFWLEQNARLLATTIQALEVQRMTLATLKTMNLPLADLADSLKIKTPEAAAPPPPAPAPPPAPQPSPPPAPRAQARRASAQAAPAAQDTAKPAVDPLQWWGALTQQFTELASQALKDSPAEAAAAALKSATQAAAKSAMGAARKATAKAGAKAGSQAATRARPRAAPAARKSR